MASSVDNVKIVPVNVLWKMEQTDVFDFAGLTGVGLTDKTLHIWKAKDVTKYYAYFKVDGAGTDPAPAGFTKIEIAILSTDTPAQIATKFKTALNAVATTPFVASVSDTIVRNARADVGETTESVDVDSDIVISLSRRGRDYDLGLLEGDVNLDFKPANFILNAHQFGKTPLAALNQGLEKLECGTNLLETQTSQLETLYKIYGGTETPMGGTKVYGVGSASQGKNMMVEAGRLVLKPVNATDDTENVNMMLAVPVPESLIFSGEKPRSLKLAWQGFIDRDFNDKFNAIAVGDIFQAGL